MRIGGDTTLTDCNVSVLFFISKTYIFIIDRLKNVCYIFHKKGKKTSLIIIRPVDKGEGLLYVV